MGNEWDFDAPDIVHEDVHFKLRGRSYVIREATADAVRQYRRAISKAVTVGPEGKPSNVDTGAIGDTDILLVSLCVFDASGAGTQRVTEAEVLTWPFRAQEKVYKKVREMSGLDVPADKAADQEKNLPNATTVGTP